MNITVKLLINLKSRKFHRLPTLEKCNADQIKSKSIAKVIDFEQFRLKYHDLRPCRHCFPLENKGVYK